MFTFKSPISVEVEAGDVFKFRRIGGSDKTEVIRITGKDAGVIQFTNKRYGTEGMTFALPAFEFGPYVEHRAQCFKDEHSIGTEQRGKGHYEFELMLLRGAIAEPDAVLK